MCMYLVHICVTVLCILRIFIQQRQFGYTDLAVGNIQLAMANLRCFDASKNTQQTYFNWFDEHNIFIAAARRAPPYTEIFWMLWLKIASNFGNSAKDLSSLPAPPPLSSPFLCHYPLPSLPRAGASWSNRHGRFPHPPRPRPGNPGPDPRLPRRGTPTPSS